MTTYTYEVIQQSGPGAHFVTQRVYPCRCGETHRGLYAFEDWIMHEHAHQKLWVDGELAFCDCGMVFEVENASDSGVSKRLPTTP